MSLYYDLLDNKLNEEAMFIGHKLKYQDLQKQARFSSDYIRFITDALRKNSDVGMYGSFCKDYPEYVSLYWHFGGKKMQPTKEECKAFIERIAELNVDDLDDDQKWELFNKGFILGYDRDAAKHQDIETVDLDEGTLKNTAMTAAVLSALAGGAAMNTKGDQVKDIHQDPAGDYLVVPDYKDMPNLWGDVDTKPQKVSVAKPVRQATTTTKKAVPEPTVKTVPAKAETKKASPVTQTIAKSAETFNDAFNKEWDLNKAYDFVLHFEKFSPKAYKDGTIRYNNGKIGTRWSIGYGTKSPNNSPRATISEPEARKAKCEHIKNNVLPLLKKKKVVIQNQNQFDAIVSFVYNTGKIFQKKDGTADIERMQKWIYFNGKPNAGLQRRRNAEAIHFLTGM